MRKISEAMLDKRWGLIVRERAKHKCEHCGKPGNQPHHIFSRNNRNVRWDIDDGVCLCVSCHTFNNYFSAHRTPTEFTFWLIRYKGKAFLNKLRIKAQKHVLNDQIFRQKKLKELGMN